jgi:pimeloyl-ACP methyl ester carboxylesterase
MAALASALIFAIALFHIQVTRGSGLPSDTLYARPSLLVGDKGVRLSLYCIGSGSPAVIFDSGFSDWAPAWSTVQPEIAKWTRACSYDHAGAGFSDPGPLPRTSLRIAQELHGALHRAGIEGPFILVGHAFGGDQVRTFADLYMSEVAGLVLVDADATDLEPEWMQELDRRGRPDLISYLRECRNKITGHPPLPSGVPAETPQKSCSQKVFFRGLPEVKWSQELNSKMLELAQTKSAMYDAFASEMEQMTQDEIYLEQHQRSFGARPIRILTSGNHGVPASAPDRAAYEQEITRAQARWLGLSSNARQLFPRSASEYIQFEDPDSVVGAVREVYEEFEKLPAARD